MSIIKRNPLLFPTFNNIMEEFWNKDVSPYMPAVNILEQEDAFKVEIMAAGWKKENFKIEVENRTLKISAEKQSQSEEQKGKYTHREFNVNAFRRSFSLPSTVDSDKIEAQYQEGILVLTLPKREEAKVRKVVEIV